MKTVFLCGAEYINGGIGVARKKVFKVKETVKPKATTKATTKAKRRNLDVIVEKINEIMKMPDFERVFFS